MILLAGWLVLAAVPAALTVPSGVWQPEAGGCPPTYLVLMQNIGYPNLPVTPALLFDHPEARRDTLAMTPWTVLSAVGLIVLLEMIGSSSAFATLVVVVLSLGTIYSGGRFVRAYFGDYPIEAAPYFQYGMEQAVAATRKAAGATSGGGHYEPDGDAVYLCAFLRRVPAGNFSARPGGLRARGWAAVCVGGALR